MDKIDYFAFTCLIASFVFIMAYAELDQHWKGNTLRNRIAEMFGIMSCITFGLFMVYVLYLWISFFFTL